MSNEFDEVSSWYGPGPIAAWYMTGASVLASWLYTWKEAEEWVSVEPDFVVFLIYPLIAAGDTLVQSSTTRRIFRHLIHAEAEAALSTADLQAFRAAEAPFCVIQAFLLLQMYFICLAASRLSIWRVRTLAIAYLLCMIAQLCVQPYEFGRLTRAGADNDLLVRFAGDSNLSNFFAAGTVYYAEFFPAIYVLLVCVLLEWGVMEPWQGRSLFVIFFLPTWYYCMSMFYHPQLSVGQRFGAFIPRSSNSLLELDQCVTLVTAVVVQVMYKTWYFRILWKDSRGLQRSPLRRVSTRSYLEQETRERQD